MTWPFGDLKMFGYDVICADPPWQFERWSDKNQSKGAADQYDLMPLDAIKALPVGQLAARDCLLLMWTCGWAIATGQAQEVAKAWGFDPVTELVWRKVTRAGKVRMGTGYWARTIHEPILLCTTGYMRVPAFPSLFDGVAREHSRKPDQFYDLVKARTIGMRRADLFSRETRVGFDGWGNEHGKFDAEVPSVPAKPASERNGGVCPHAPSQDQSQEEETNGSRNEREQAQFPSLFGKEV